MAAMPVQFEKNVINFLPITAAREMYEPFHRLKYSFAATYYDQIRAGAAQDDQGQGRQEGLHHLPGRRVRPRSACAAPRPASRPPGMELAEKTSLQARRDRLLLAGREDEGGQLRPGGAGHHHPRDHRHRRRGAQDRLQPDLPRLQRGLHRPDPQARRQGDGRRLRHPHRAAPLPDEQSQPHPLLGQQVQDQVQRRPDGVLGLRLFDRRLVHQGRAEGRPQPHDRQLHQGDGQHDLRARHVRRPRRAPTPPPSAWATTSRACRRSRTASGRWCRTTWRPEALLPAQRQIVVVPTGRQVLPSGVW